MPAMLSERSLTRPETRRFVVGDGRIVLSSGAWTRAGGLALILISALSLAMTLELFVFAIFMAALGMVLALRGRSVVIDFQSGNYREYGGIPSPTAVRQGSLARFRGIELRRELRSGVMWADAAPRWVVYARADLEGESLELAQYHTRSKRMGDRANTTADVRHLQFVAEECEWLANRMGLPFVDKSFAGDIQQPTRLPGPTPESIKVTDNLVFIAPLGGAPGEAGRLLEMSTERIRFGVEGTILPHWFSGVPLDSIRFVTLWPRPQSGTYGLRFESEIVSQSVTLRYPLFEGVVLDLESAEWLRDWLHFKIREARGYTALPLP